MVTARNPTSFGSLARRNFATIITKLGQSTFTVYAQTETTNNMGRLSNVTETTTSSIKGSLQFVTAQDKEFLDAGVATVGEAIFYAAHDVTLVENDEIEQSGDSHRWKLTRLIEAEKPGGLQVYQAWVCVRKEDA